MLIYFENFQNSNETKKSRLFKCILNFITCLRFQKIRQGYATLHIDQLHL